jgi:hypothetical protein
MCALIPAAHCLPTTFAIANPLIRTLWLLLTCDMVGLTLPKLQPTAGHVVAAGQCSVKDSCGGGASGSQQWARASPTGHKDPATTGQGWPGAHRYMAVHVTYAVPAQQHCLEEELHTADTQLLQHSLTP